MDRDVECLGIDSHMANRAEGGRLAGAGLPLDEVCEGRCARPDGVVQAAVDVRGLTRTKPGDIRPPAGVRADRGFGVRLERRVGDRRRGHQQNRQEG